MKAAVKDLEEILDKFLETNAGKRILESRIQRARQSFNAGVPGPMTVHSAMMDASSDIRDALFDYVKNDLGDTFHDPISRCFANLFYYFTNHEDGKTLILEKVSAKIAILLSTKSV